MKTDRKIESKASFGVWFLMEKLKTLKDAKTAREKNLGDGYISVFSHIRQ